MTRTIRVVTFEIYKYVQITAIFLKMESAFFVSTKKYEAN